MASHVEGRCTALNVSDGKLCEETATSMNGLFCAFHSKQCQGLYRGYKRRNADLDRLAASPPQYLADSKTPLANQLFADVDSEEVSQEIHQHLFRKFQLLQRVIRARELHHSRFFSMNYDYGHAKFLDQLKNERATATRALERIERRTAEILYKNQKWFKWVRQCQDEDEAHREKEQKRVKQEAALFRRHWKEVQQRLKEKRANEDQKKQDAFLEKVYKERLGQQEEEEADEFDWDPIEDVIEDNRGNLVDLIKHFLWMVLPENITEGDEKVATSELKGITDVRRPGDDEEEIVNKGEPSNVSPNENKLSLPASIESEKENEISNTNEDKKPASSKKSKSSKKKKSSTSSRKPATPSPDNAPSDTKAGSISNGDQILALSESSKISKSKGKAADKSPLQEPDKSLIETREQMHERLKNGQEYNLDEIVGVMVAGTVENPVVATRTVTFPDDQIEKLLTEVTEIKHFLFCRLLLGHATLLPAALRADNVEDFLNDTEVTESALRDVCLKMERPGLQEIRDACADLFRSIDKEEGDGNDQIDDGENDADDSASDELYDMRILKPEKPKGALPDKWMSKREKTRANLADMPTRESLLGGDEGTAIDFGEIKDGKFHKRMVRVKICGRTIWNYPSNKAMTRKGWLHFCIIAKDSSLHDAIELCRHWDEFFELNILSIWHYFPGANWAGWVGNRWRQQMLELGFIMYYESSDPDAWELTQHHQTGSRRGLFRRQHAMLEARNFICAHIKRDDPVGRRLVQYLSMQSHRLLVLVRDAESGRLLIKPPEDQRWILREKSGFGRAAKNQWNVLKSIGPQFFEEMDDYRKWNFRFKEYYDVYVWDLSVGESFPHLYNAVQQILFKAHRCCRGADLYNPAAPFLKTLTKDSQTHRARDIKPGEEGVMSIYDDIHHEGTQFFYGEVDTLKASHEFKRRIQEPNTFPRSLFYNEADALEDEILFPEERSGVGVKSGALGIMEPIRRWEEEGFSLRKWVEGYCSESDYDSDAEEGEDDDEEDADDDEEVVDDEEDEEGTSEENDQPLDETDGALESSKAIPDELQQLLDSIVLQHKNHPEKSDFDTEREGFMDFLDREKARTLKEVWHKADLEPEAQTRYIEMKELARKSLKFHWRSLKHPVFPFTLSLVKWLDAAPGDDTKDINKAIAKLSPFFYPEFFESEEGARFRDSLLFKQEERANHIPDIRSDISNARRLKEFWKEWDGEKKMMKSLDDTPAEWDIAIRPIIARLYKAGVIRNRAAEYYSGQAIAGQEPHRSSWDLFFDWRPMTKEVTLPPTMQDPFSIPPFLHLARRFSSSYPDARFSVLRLWSAPHFYPLMIGPDNQDPTSFQDLTGRTFVWMFVPKCMPYSEWSMHHTSRQRISSEMGGLWEKFKEEKVVVKRNAFLVMGVDTRDCMRLSMATCWAVERKPWRWEVDLWKSFINVDLGFLEGLGEGWLE